jgi:competence protein ComEC
MGLRARALERVEQMYGAGSYRAGMLQAILIGQTFQLERVWTESFRSTGTFHALVISGSHVAVLAVICLFLLRLCFFPRWLAAPLTVLLCCGYALLTGWQPPAARAAAGLGLFLAAGFFHRERRLLNLLAAAAIVFLLLDPEQLFEPSFQLSFLAAGLLASLALPLIGSTSSPRIRALSRLQDARRDANLPPAIAQFRVELRLLAETLRLCFRMPEKIAGLAVTLPLRAAFHVYQAFAVSAVVQLGLLLPMVIYFHRAGISGLSANLLVVPLTGWMIPAGFAAILTGSEAAASVTAGLLDAAQAIAAWHAGFEPGWRIPAPPLWLAVFVGGSLCALALAAGRRSSGARTPRVAAGAALAMICLGLALLLWHPFAPQVPPGQLELVAIDVGQGDSLAVTFPDGKLMLVDSGGILSFGDSARARLDIGEDVVSPYLWSRSVRRIDVLALTHPHQDHIGGAAALIRNFSVGEIWTGPQSGELEEIELLARARGIPVVRVHSGRATDIGGARLEVLAPPARAADTRERAANDASLVLRLSFGRHSFVLAGDIEGGQERELLSNAVLGRADVLKVAHHGSGTSTSQEFLDAVRPTFALISAGAANSYGHPHPDVLKRLEQMRTLVLRTDLGGLAAIRSDGYRLEVNRGAAGPGLPLVF